MHPLFPFLFLLPMTQTQMDLRGRGGGYIMMNKITKRKRKPKGVHIVKLKYFFINLRLIQVVSNLILLKQSIKFQIL